MANIAKGRAGLLALLLLLGLLLASCGGAADTPVPAATDTPAAAAPTNTAAVIAPTDTTAAAMTPTEMSATTPTAMAAVTATVGTAPAGATPVSNWKSGAHAKSITAPAKLVAAGTLTVGSDASYPPQEYIDASGKAVGMDIDIMEEIASRLGLTLKVVNFKFDDLISAVNAGQFDAVVSAMTITADRSKAVDFVQYFEAGQAVLVAKGNPKGIKTLDDLSGKTAAAQQGTTEETTLKDLNTKLKAAGKPEVNVLTYPADTDAVDQLRIGRADATLKDLNTKFAAAGKPAVTVLTYPSDTDAVDQLRIGRADATLHDSPVAAYYAKLNANFEVAIASFAAAPEGIATAKNNKPMFDAINAAITAMKSDGSLDAIKAKWGVK